MFITFVCVSVWKWLFYTLRQTIFFKNFSVLLSNGNLPLKHFFIALEKSGMLKVNSCIMACHVECLVFNDMKDPIVLQR